jgi:hypothetical protein
LLDNYGLDVSTDILMDENCVPLNVQGGNSLQDVLSGGQPIKLPMHILLHNTSMAADTSITSRLAQIFYLWGTSVKLDDAKLKQLNLNAKVVMHSSDQSWTVPGDAPLTKTSFSQPADPKELKQYPLMAVIDGQFPDAYAGKDRPAWPKAEQQPGQPPQPDAGEKEAPAAPVEAKPGKLIVVGCSEMFRKNFLKGSGNLDLFMNSIDAITLNENLVNVRGRKPIDRAINAPTDSQKTFWRFANYGLANILIAVVGVGLFAYRKRARNAYTMSFINRSN